MPNKPPTLADAQRFTTVQNQQEWDVAGWSNEALPPAQGPRRLESVVSLRLDYRTVQRFRKNARLMGRSLSDFLRIAGDELSDKTERATMPAIRVTRVHADHEPGSVTTSSAAMEIDRRDLIKTR